ncbi:MAG: hypothetical protein IBJ17_02760 [Reyranella sp.]|nr:hypothetical protein [Reyranella sp.]
MAGVSDEASIVSGSNRCFFLPPAEARAALLSEYVLRPRGKRSRGDDIGFPVSFTAGRDYWSTPGAQSPWISGTEIAVWQRLIVHYGLNLYCAACRQIALASTGAAAALAAAREHTAMLLSDRAGQMHPLRAWSGGKEDWRYGDGETSLEAEGESAFFFGAISEHYDLTDPLTGGSRLPSELGGGKLVWNFYDPFLGENSWAALIGPLQVAYRSNGTDRWSSANPAVCLAKSIVPACKAMQSTIGGVYARPSAKGRPQERLISNETNLTLFAGLAMLRQVLQKIPELANCLPEVDGLLSGLLSYFRSHLAGVVDGELRFHACGSFGEGGFRPGVMSNGRPAPFAADVHTWGLSVLGVEEVDSRHGHGACLALWEAVKRHTGFYDNCGQQILKGIGFSSGPGGEPVHDVCSPEWTFGAINMCRIIAAEYELPGRHRDPVLAQMLRRDERSMIEGVSKFATNASAEATALAYLYANRRTETGFGWDALPVPSLCATAWALMVENNFNPFYLGGGTFSANRGLDLSSN